MPKALILRSKTSRMSTPSVKARLNQEKQRSINVQHEKTTKQRVPSVEIVSDNEQSEITVSTKRKPLSATSSEYLLTARTYVGIQSVYRESMSVRIGLWPAKRYFNESTNRVENTANERGIEPVLHSSTATICSKSMKQADYITCDVNEPEDWCKVESIVNHLAKSLSKGIRVDFVIKYNAKRPAKEVDDVEVVEMMELEENEVSTAKRARKVVRAHFDY